MWIKTLTLYLANKKQKVSQQRKLYLWINYNTFSKIKKSSETTSKFRAKRKNHSKSAMVSLVIGDKVQLKDNIPKEHPS